jgi:hypothetical protein
MLSFCIKVKATSTRTGVVTSWVTTKSLSKVIDAEMGYCLRYHKDIIMIEFIDVTKSKT